jgi:hypothetical protein
MHYVFVTKTTSWEDLSGENLFWRYVLIQVDLETLIWCWHYMFWVHPQNQVLLPCYHLFSYTFRCLHSAASDAIMQLNMHLFIIVFYLFLEHRTALLDTFLNGFYLEPLTIRLWTFGILFLTEKFDFQNVLELTSLSVLVSLGSQNLRYPHSAWLTYCPNCDWNFRNIFFCFFILTTLNC